MNEEEIIERVKDLKEQLKDVQRTPCEVYSRVVMKNIKEQIVNKKFCLNDELDHVLRQMSAYYGQEEQKNNYNYLYFKSQILENTMWRKINEYNLIPQTEKPLITYDEFIQELTVYMNETKNKKHFGYYQLWIKWLNIEKKPNKKMIQKAIQEERNKKAQIQRNWLLILNAFVFFITLLYISISCILLFLVNYIDLPKTIIKIPIKHFLNNYILVISLILFYLTIHIGANTNAFVDEDTTKKPQEKKTQ